MQAKKKDGTLFWISASTCFIDFRGEQVGLSAFIDITERKRMEDELRRSQEQLEARVQERTAELAALLDSVPTPVFIAHDPNCVHITGNRAADEMLRNPRGGEACLEAPEALRPQHFRAFKDGRELEVKDLPAQRAARGEDVQGMEFSLVFDDGTVREVIGYARPLLDAAGQARGSILSLADITERKRAEEALRVLTVQMEEIREHERQRLGRELHDGLSQLLTGMKFKVGLLKRQLEREMPVDAAEVGGLEDEVNQALNHARNMARGLNPATLMTRGLVAALEDLARSASKTFQVDCVCAAAAPVVVADQEVALHLYRIAQEAAQNAAQHARPRHIVIRLTARAGLGCLEVLDDGIGFSPSDSTAGMGLSNLQTRAQAIGGRLEIQPRPGGGTAITCSWPLSPPPK